MRHHAVLAIALCALLSTPGHAAVSATASLHFRPLTLLDLDPDDGIAPSLTWTWESDVEKPVTDLRLAARASFDPLRGSYDDSYNDFFELWPSGLTPTTGPGLANASAGMSSPDPIDPTQGTYMFAGGSIDTAANSVTDAEFSFSSFIQAGSIGNLYRHFVVSPMTRVVFSADATVTNYLDDPLAWNPAVGETVYATAQFTLGPLFTNAGLTAYGEGYRSAYFRSETVNAIFDNTIAGEASGWLYAKVEVNGFRSAAAPVPEPQSWALLVCGLLTVSAMARGRSRSRAGSSTSLAGPPMQKASR